MAAGQGQERMGSTELGPGAEIDKRGDEGGGGGCTKGCLTESLVLTGALARGNDSVLFLNFLGDLLGVGDEGG